MTDKNFRTWLDRLLIAAGILFLLSLAVTTNVVVSMYRSDLETRFSPVFVDRTHTDWRQDEKTDFWSSAVFINKLRPSCVYVDDQIETVIGITPGGDIVEAAIRYVADPTPGSNRPVGWQQLDTRVMLLSDEITVGTILRGTVLHQCGEADRLTVTEWGPSIVGEDEGLPYYVQEWIDAGREGSPAEYR